MQLRGRQPQGTKFWCQQKPLVTSVICYKFKKNLFEVWFYTYFFFRWFIQVYGPRAGVDSPQGTKIWCQQKCRHVTSFICCKDQKNVFEVWFYTLFFSWFNVYSSGAGTDSHRIRVFIFAGTKREKPGPKSRTKTLKIQEKQNSDFSQRLPTSVAICINGDIMATDPLKYMILIGTNGN